MTPDPITIHVTLTRLFLRRFLENDLLSPDADRTHTLAMTGASLFTTSLFISVATSILRYIATSLTPGQAAIEALDDRFFYIAISMIVLALAAVAQWDALSLDARDAEILGPLPVTRFALHRAKLAAVAIFGVGAAAIVNLMPTIVFPMMLVEKHHVGVPALLYLTLVHLVVVLAAAACGYLAIIGLREGLAALLGPRRFSAVSPWAQALMVVVLGTTLLLTPAISSNVEGAWFGARARLSPPMWFLGAYEHAAGWVVAGASRRRLSFAEERTDAIFTAAYRRHEAEFAPLATRAGLTLIFVTLLAAIAYALNARRRSSAVTAAAPRHRHRLTQHALAAIADPEATARAGFFFTLAAVWRNPAHRLTLTASAAVGLAAALIAVSTADLPALAAADGESPARLLITQPLFVGVLLLGFRHAVRVPAELRANWIFQLTWRNRQRLYVDGVKRAAIVGVALPALAVLFPLDTAVLGPWQAITHALLGAAAAVVFVDALMIRCRKVPCVCAYLPYERLKALAPLYVLLFILGSAVFAELEASALASPMRTVVMLLVMTIASFALRVATLRGRLAPMEFNEAPPRATLRLDLNT